MKRRLTLSTPTSRASVLILGLLAVAILISEGRRQIEVGIALNEREQLLGLRREVLRLERELLLARSDEAEVTSAGRLSLRQRLVDRHQQIEIGLGEVSDKLAPLFADRLDLSALVQAVGKYRQSVDAELALLSRIGDPETGGLLAKLRKLETRLLDNAGGGGLQKRLLEMQLQQRDFVATLKTSEALALLEKVDALSLELSARTPPSGLAEALSRYRLQVEEVMASSLERTLIQGESGVRFDRLSTMFRAVEQPLDRSLESNAFRIAQLRRQAGWLATALLSVALLLLGLRVRYQRDWARKMSDRVRRLGAGMRSFADGAEETTLDLPQGGDLGQVTTSFLDMARQIRAQIKTIDDERRRAEEATLAKSEFLALVSHELRTPLNGILGTAELLDPSLTDPRKRHLLDVIQRSGATLLSVVNDLLDFSTLEAGRLELEPRPFDLVDMLEDLMEIHAPAAHDKGLELVLCLPSSLSHHLVGDPMRLGQVLTNLIGNALKFTERGHVEVEVHGLERRADGSRSLLEISVRDTGPGIPEHLRAHIFGAFAQGEATLRRKHGGSGLGLSIVRELLELMNGSIRLEETEGEPAGAHFIFGAEVMLAQPPAAAEPEVLLAAPLAGQHLLLVDAHPPSAEALAARLVALGAEVTAYVDAEAALTVEHPPLDAALLGHPAAAPDSALPRLAEAMTERGILVLHLLPTSRWQLEANLPGQHLTRPPRRSSLLEALSSSPMAALQPVERPDISHPRLEGAVLLAEDNPINRLVLETMIENTGCRVVVVENGHQAIEKLDTEPFDLILMDCYMPEMDGYETTRHIRRLGDSRLANLPIIALTASAFEANRKRCLDAGMDEVLAKPTTTEAVQDCLGRWLAASEPTPARH